MKLLLFGKKEKDYLSAEKTRNILEFGRMNTTIQRALDVEIDDIELSIKYRAERGLRMMAREYPNLKRSLTELLKEHFEKEGFVAEIYENQEIKDCHALVIGW